MTMNTTKLEAEKQELFEDMLMCAPSYCSYWLEEAYDNENGDLVLVEDDEFVEEGANREHVLTAEVLEAGILAWSARYMEREKRASWYENYATSALAGDWGSFMYDSEFLDCAVQMGIFGDVVYG